LSSSAAQREIPPDLVYEASTLPSSFSDGAVLLVDKPKGVTSFDVVKAVRGRVGPSKVGHAGTLDPMATGLLIILVARPATRLQEAFMHLPKTYEGTMRLGEQTPSHDAETAVEARSDISHLSLDDIAAVRDQFTGQIAQVPPMYSAVKVDGEPLYKKARRGETVELRTVEPEDAAFLASLVNDPRVRRGTAMAEPISEGDERDGSSRPATRAGCISSRAPTATPSASPA